ncbi:hypothetical protein BpHYR1_046017 [Brachionus plicatilis]|uniref:FLYWCH-type domain-containing protein n=1 Tax=Brachionus plicatilis TaxID=10195 RepID=A0A3M7QWV4_BRAPC|nr:hypothetical protein BpHYR1_046017 [Brachionus plicatilis]
MENLFKNLKLNTISPMRLRSRNVPRVASGKVADSVPSTGLYNEQKDMDDDDKDEPELAENADLDMNWLASSVIGSYVSMHSAVNQLDSFSEQDKIDHKVSGDNLIKTLEVKQTPEHKLVDYSDSESIVSIVEDFRNSEEEFFNESDLLIDEEYLDERKEELYWKCLVFEPVQCKARIHTNEQFEIITFKNDHYHPPAKPEKLLSKILCNDLKDRAVKTSEKPREIITDTLLKIPPNAASSLPTIQNLTQVINRERKKIKPFGKNEKSLIDLVIVDEFKYTKSGKKFLFFDSGNEDPERLIILSTDENIALLSYEPCWFIDGTFEISPEVFTQVFTINIIKNNRNIPLVYAFLDTIKAFNYIKEICPKEGKSFIDYFEKNYIGLPKPERSRSVPLFPIKYWNLHNRIQNDLPRSNNSLEAWHQAVKTTSIVIQA